MMRDFMYAWGEYTYAKFVLVPWHRSAHSEQASEFYAAALRELADNSIVRQVVELLEG